MRRNYRLLTLWNSGHGPTEDYPSRGGSLQLYNFVLLRVLALSLLQEFGLDRCFSLNLRLDATVGVECLADFDVLVRGDKVRRLLEVKGIRLLDRMLKVH